MRENLTKMERFGTNPLSKPRWYSVALFSMDAKSVLIILGFGGERTLCPPHLLLDSTSS
jgi:hypothetical protein